MSKTPIVFEVKANNLENVDVLLNNEIFRSFSYFGKEDGTDIILGRNDGLEQAGAIELKAWSEEHLLFHILKYDWKNSHPLRTRGDISEDICASPNQRWD